MFKEGEMQFRTFNVLDNGPDGKSKVVGKVTACVLYNGFAANGTTTMYRVGFSYCSPKEKQSNRNIGQFIAQERMWSEKGSLYVLLEQEDPANPTMKGLTGGIKDLIVSEAERKQIRWLKGIQQYQLV